MKRQKFKNKVEEIKHEEEYMAFLRKRLDSNNYKANETPEEYAKTKEKYDKVKFRLRLLKGK